MSLSPAIYVMFPKNKYLTFCHRIIGMLFLKMHFEVYVVATLVVLLKNIYCILDNQL